jgi:hypothetical protein
MEHLEHVEGDLRFVRRALDASTRGGSPSTLYFLWAGICLIGFALVDFRVAWVSTYWSIAGPLGFIASAFLGWRHGRRVGQVSSSDGGRYLLHWGGVLVAIALAVWLRTRGGISPEHFHAVILLVLALGYFTAGLHLDRPFVWVGLLMAGGFVVVTLVSWYAWTTVGLALAAALTVAGIREGRTGEATT